MAYEVKLGQRKAKVELLSQDGNSVKILVDHREYDLDLLQVEKGVYSILFKGRSYNVELIAAPSPKKYTVNTFYHSYNAEIIDAESRYLMERNAANIEAEQHTISSPMPGKVVDILTTLGSKVKKGDTLIVISAMKMESEYKAMKDGVIKEIYVKPDQTIDGHQPLIYIE